MDASDLIKHCKTPCEEGAVHIWIHAERLVHKLETFTDHQRVAQQHVRGLIWWFYADLKAYRLEPTWRRWPWAPSSGW